jgi:hypothetical protein
MHTFGVHQTVTRNANQATGGTPQNNLGGYINEVYPEAVFKQNQLVASVNSKITKNLSATGFYTMGYANGNNNGNATDGYDLDKDYGRSGFVARNMLFLMGNYTAPWGIRLSPFMLAQSGRPYNITQPTDYLNGFGNQRPSYATSATPTINEVVTSFGLLDYTGATGTPLPVNLGNGPAAVAVNLRISRGFGIGPKIAPANPNADGGMPPGGPPPGGGDHGGHGGGGGRGGPGGGGGFGMGGPGGGGANNTGRKYALNFSVQALNLFNDIDYGTPNGSISLPPPNSGNGPFDPGNQFGKSTSLAGGMFSQGSAARRVFAQVVFSF